MHHRLHRSALAAATLLLAARPALAQEPIRLGQTITSQLTETDPVMSSQDSSHYKAFRYHGRRGEAVKVTLRSTDFDAFLNVGRPGPSGAFVSDRVNDDGAGGTDAQMTYVFTTDGDLEIRANSLQEATGAFTLQLERGTPPGPVVDHRINIGQTVNGTLTERSPQERDETYFEQYSFTGRAGQTVQVTMSATDVDPYLSLGRTGADGFTSLATDDDHGGGTTARIVFTIPANGTYVIHANTVAKGTGAFELALAEGTASEATNRPAGEIAAGQPVSGTLESTDPRAGDGSYYDAYVYHGKAGEHIAITMRAPDFDAYLSVGKMTDGAYEGTGSDDDSGGGTDARVEMTLAQDGDIIIRANSLESGSTGGYTLQVEKL